MPSQDQSPTAPVKAWDNGPGVAVTPVFTEEEDRALRGWASVGRTLREAKALLDLCDDALDVEEDEETAELADRICDCLDELEDLIPLLESLHTRVREQLVIRQRTLTKNQQD